MDSQEFVLNKKHGGVRDSQSVGLCAFQVAGSRFASIVCNEARFHETEFAFAAMKEADYFNIYNLRRRTFPSTFALQR